MTKKNAIKALSPIISNLENPAGAGPLPIQTLFRYDPETLVEILLKYTEEEIFSVLTDPDAGQPIGEKEARQYAKRLKRAVI